MSRLHAFPALPLLALGYGGGVLAGAVLGGPWLLTALLGAMVAAIAWLRGDPRVLLLAGAVLLTAAGHARIAAIDAAPAPALAAMTGTHEVTGTVRADAVVRGSIERVDIAVAAVHGVPASGGIRVHRRVEGTPLEAGERVRFTAELEPPPRLEAYDYAEYLRSRDIVLVASFPDALAREGRDDLGWRGALLGLRRGMVERIERALPEPAAALAAGVLVGERTALPEDVDATLRATGTTHLVVVSGQNVALLLGIALAALTAVMSRRLASVALLLALPAYVLFVGADPPVVRAALMAVAVVAAGITGRRTPGWVFLLYALAAMLAWDPAYARDVAFQLSAAATAGVVILAPVLRDAVLAAWPVLTAPRRAALVEVSATATGAALAVLPVQVATFERIAPWTVVANVIVAPLYEATVAVAALAALLGGLGGEPVSTALAIVPRAFLWVVETLAGLPYAEVPVRLPLVLGIAFVTVLVALAAALSRRRPAIALEPVGAPVPVSTLSLGVIAVSLWVVALTPANDLASVTVLDVGQGLAVLVRDGDRTLLIDTGPPDERIVAALGERGVRHLDAVAVTHADVDHAGALEAVHRRFDVDRILAEPGTLAALAVEGLAVEGEAIDIGDRVQVGDAGVTVIGPPVATRDESLASDNNGSLVLMITIGERRILVTADIEAEAEAWLVESGADLRADVLVIGHHGSRTSSTPAFLAAVGPEVAVIPVGANPYGHPHDEVLARLEGAMEVYRTDEDGDVTLRSDGARLWVQAER